MLADLQRRFDAHADGYRAQLDRITAQAGATPLEKETIRRDLDTLRNRRPHVTAHMPEVILANTYSPI